MGFNLNSPEGHSAWDYAQTIVNLLHEIRTAIQDSQGNDPVFRRFPFVIPCDPTGAGRQEIIIPRNARWTLQKIAFQGSNTGFLATYVGEEQGTGLLKVNASSALVSDTFDDDQIGKDDGKIILVCSGQVANTIVSGNLRFLQYEDNETNPKRAVG